MRISDLGLATLLLAVACSQPPPAAPPAAPAATTPATTKPAPAQEIYIDAVTVANPVIVKGRARTFENNVAIRARDANGDLILETFTTSVGEMGHHNPFEAELWLVRDPGKQVMVDAFEYSAKDGSVRSLTTKVADAALPTMTVQLTFPRGDCDDLRQFARVVPKSPGIARLLVEALLAGPTAPEKAAGASSPFPRGSGLKSVILRDGILTVDFTDRLQNVGGSCAAIAIRNAVTRTLEQLPTVKRIVITAGGSEKLALQP